MEDRERKRNTENKKELDWISSGGEISLEEERDADDEEGEISFNNEFVINDFLTLKLEEGKTNIYIKGKRYYQCKFLMMTIPFEEIERFDEIESIDEAADMLGWENEGQDVIEYKIDPEAEFWGHCSNLQAWYEYNYDTRLLHSNLSFPLLKKLAEVGDPVAKASFKEEIAKRFESGYPSIVAYLIIAKFLNYLSEEEQRDLIKKNLQTVLNTFENLTGETQINLFEYLIPLSKKTGLLEDNFVMFLESINKVPGYEKYHAFFNLIDSISDTELLDEYKIQIETQFLALVDGINKITKNNDDDKRRYRASSKLLNAVKIIGLKKEHIATLLNVFPDFDYEPYGLYDDLLSTITNEKQRFEIIITILKTTKKPFFKSYIFNSFLTLIEDSDIVREKFTEIIMIFKEVLEGNIRDLEYEFFMVYRFIVKFIETLIRVGFLNTDITVKSDYYSNDYYERLDHSIKGVFALIGEIEDTEILEYLLPCLLMTFWRYSDRELNSDNYQLFSLLFEIAYKRKILENNFIYFIVYYNWNYVGIANLLEVFLRSFNRKEIISLLTSALQNSELMLRNKNYERFLYFLKRLSKGCDNLLKKSIVEIKISLGKLLEITDKKVFLYLG